MRNSGPKTTASLKQQLQSKLNVTWVAGGADAPERRGAEEVVRQVEVWMIEEVKGFRSELQVHPFREMRILHDCGVEVLITRSIQNIPARIAKRSGRREGKGIGVEPTIGCRIR